MTMRLSLLALPLALAAPFAFAAAPAAAAVVQAAEPGQQARALAALVHPVELAVATATEGSDRYFVQAMLKNADIAALEKQHPGILEIMYKAARPFMIEAERRNAVKAQEMLTALYLKELAAEDLPTLHRFFASPTGQKVIRGMFNPKSIQHTAEAIAADPTGDVKAETLLVGQAQAVGRMAAGLTAEDEKVAAELLKTPTGARWHTLTPKVHAMMLDIVNADHPDLQVQVDAAMEAAATAFMASSKD